MYGGSALTPAGSGCPGFDENCLSGLLARCRAFQGGSLAVRVAAELGDGLRRGDFKLMEVVEHLVHAVNVPV